MDGTLGLLERFDSWGILGLVSSADHACSVAKTGNSGTIVGFQISLVSSISFFRQCIYRRVINHQYIDYTYILSLLIGMSNNAIFCFYVLKLIYQGTVFSC